MRRPPNRPALFGLWCLGRLGGMRLGFRAYTKRLLEIVEQGVPLEDLQPGDDGYAEILVPVARGGGIALKFGLPLIALLCLIGAVALVRSL